MNEVEPPADLDAYIVPGRRWSLIKLHGSINWGREVRDGYARRPMNAPGWRETYSDEFAQLEDLEDRLSRDIEFCPGRDLADYRFKASRPGQSSARRQFMEADGILRYPALAVPLGAEDELVCPPSHVSFLRKRLQAEDGLNLLVIGYSGLDTEVLKLLSESKNSIRRLLVVDPSEKHAKQAAENIGAALGFGGGFQADWPRVQAFSDFAQGTALQEFIDTLT